ncbi:geraniol 8-hydroxylase [Ziziphus jujuba]|uniref:Geraniol 8-hydroxylase n=1 Tax=Ziziphus jujuba TaxID=326968 RepID=A0A6P4A879_ZIZJJ|nr:geraniol 8-hydroxylase [Ziziphus jujuba]
MEFLLSILCIILTWIFVQALRSITRGKTRSRKLPPGPKPLPIIGNLHQLGNKPHKSLAELAEIHGPLMTMKLGQVTTIVVSSAAMAKEILQTHDQNFSNRAIPDAIRAQQHDVNALPWIPVSKLWRTLRKICNIQLFSTKILDNNQNLRQRKVQELVADVHKSSLTGEAVDMGSAAFTTTVNLMSNTVFSIDLTDPSSDMAAEFRESVMKIMEGAGKPNLGDYFPLLRKIDPHGIRRSMTIHFGKILDVLDRMMNERLQFRKLPGSSRKNDVLDTLLDIIEENSEEINKFQIQHLLLVLFVAGTDTTASTFQWAMAELLRKPEILSKARAELEKIIGIGNPIEESDIARLPYLQAIVKETFRLHPALPLLLPRKAEADVEIGGIVIPKGAQLFINAWAIGRDPSTWDDPNSFNPERFLGSEMDVKGTSFGLIPFGGGRRICPGLPLATRMLYLMLASLIHSFDWKLEDGIKPEDVNMEDKFGISLEMAQPLRAVPVTVTVTV